MFFEIDGFNPELYRYLLNHQEEFTIPRGSPLEEIRMQWRLRKPAFYNRCC